MTLPGAFLPGAGSFYDRMQQAPVYQPAPVVSILPPRPPLEAALLSVKYVEEPGRGPTVFLTLWKGLLLALNLGSESRVRLVPPTVKGGDWHLDIAPRGQEGCRLPQRGRAYFRIPTIARNHFMRPMPALAAPGHAVANENVFGPLLHFRVGEQVHEGYYRLIKLVSPPPAP